MIESASRIDPSPASASSASAASSAVHLLLPGNHLQLRQNVVELDRVKAEVLAARADGLRNVLRLGGRHHEDDVRRRLFQRLQQRVEGRLGNLVRFVEDVDLVAVARRSVARRIAQLANLVDAAIGGRVDLDHVDGVALANLDAGVADAARLRRRALRRANLGAAVQRHGQDARDGGFADAAMPGKDVAVRNAVLAERIHQRARHVVLAGHVGKALRTVFSGQNLITHVCALPSKAD